LDISLDPFQELMLYRIIQEALSNVLRHSGGKRAQVSMNEDRGYLNVGVTDDGVGFDPLLVDIASPDSSCFGLKGIQERAEMLGGDVTISAIPGQGCRIEIRLPLQLDEERVDAAYDG